MAAVMDLNILCKKNVQFEELFDILKNEFNLDIKVDNIEVMDNWKYENVINISYVNNIYHYIEANKIGSIELNILSKWRAGCQLQKINDVYLINMWINTKDLDYLDSYTINEENEYIYEFITSTIIKLVNKYNIILASIGVETMFTYNEEINEIINKSENITRWIIPNMYEKNINKCYLKEYYKPDVGVFTRIINLN